MTDPVLYELAERTGRALVQRGWMMATAESCTGGWIAEAVTMVPGSSAWFDRGFVTYTYTSKREMLGVSQATLDRFGAVSRAVVEEMTAGALKASDAHIVVAVSGTAGPGGGTEDKPVGTVCLAWSVRNQSTRSEMVHFGGDREAVRRQSVIRALEMLGEIVENSAAEAAG